MLKVRNLTESIEKKYNLDEGSATLDELPFDEIMNKESTEGNMDWYKEDHPDWKRYQSKEVDEAYEYEIEDELDYIMDDDLLSDDEKEQAISDLYSKYKLEGYNRSNSLTEAYRFKVIPEDPDRWGCSTEEEFQDILNLEDEEIVKIVKSTNGAPYYDITFDNGKQLYGVAQNCIYTSTNESLKESLDIDYSEGELFSDKYSYLDWYRFYMEYEKKTWYAAKDDSERFEATIQPSGLDSGKYWLTIRFDNKLIYDGFNYFSNDKQAMNFVEKIFMEEAGLKNESLTESVAGDIIWEKVRDYIQELIETDIVDNLASVVSSEIPEYNPDWCGDSSFTSQRAVEKLAEELATELMFNLE